MALYVKDTIRFVLISHITSGLLHLQIVISHWASETYEEKYVKDTSTNHYMHTLNTTIDVDCHEYMDWLHLGLQFQTVHHMFPRLPRHRLRQATEMVSLICKKYNLPYKKASFYEANMILIKNMHNVANNIPI